MHFIPNPSNTDFVYLLGLETVVDYLTVNKKANAVAAPFRCAQCKIDFTPVWKWEKQSKYFMDQHKQKVTHYSPSSFLQLTRMPR